MGMFQEEQFFRTLSKERLWQRYCGFLDITLSEYMEIQNSLLLEQIGLVSGTSVARKLMSKRPASASEFRRIVPLTTYDDYGPYFSRKQEDSLPEAPYFWCHSTAWDGDFRWVPYTRRAFEVAVRQCLGLAILANAGARGEVNFHPGSRILALVPPRPYTSGTMLYYLSKHFPFRFMPSLEKENQDFSDRISLGFRQALEEGVDGVFSVASVLVKIGEGMADRARGAKTSSFLWHPAAAQRLARAWVRCKMERRPILPKDLWPVKAIMTAGLDTDIYRNEIIHYWGRAPYEFYVSTEAMVMAVQSWNKKWLTFLPDTAFWEFIPEEESNRSREEEGYQPRTVLLDEVKAGKSYEVVLTRFYGVPLLRYRIGDMVTCVASRDEEAGIALPQMVFKCRVGATIDLANLCRLDEKTLWRAVMATGIKHEEWTAAKEYDRNQAHLRLYIEPRERVDASDLEGRLDRELKALDVDYRDLESYLKLRPVRVTLLAPGTFKRYLQSGNGKDSARLKVSHINPSADVIEGLVRLSDSVAPVREPVAPAVVASVSSGVAPADSLEHVRVLATVRTFVDAGVKDLVELLNTLDNVWTLESSQGRGGVDETPARVSLYYGRVGKTSVSELATFAGKLAGVVGGAGSGRATVSVEWGGEKPAPRVVIRIPPRDMVEVNMAIAGSRGIFCDTSSVSGSIPN